MTPADSIHQDDVAPDTVWWLSFASEDDHLGVALVEGQSLRAAIVTARALGCYPRGEHADGTVQGFPIPPTLSVPRHMRARLLTRDQAVALDKHWSLGERYVNGAWVKGRK